MSDAPGGSRVLVMDDDAEELQRFVKELKEAGFTPVPVLVACYQEDDKGAFAHVIRDGKELKPMLERLLPTVQAVLSDYRMGLFDGDEVANKVATLGIVQRRPVPVMVHTKDLDPLRPMYREAVAKEISALCMGNGAQKVMSKGEAALAERHEALQQMVRSCPVPQQPGMGWNSP